MSSPNGTTFPVPCQYCKRMSVTLFAPARCSEHLAADARELEVLKRRSMFQLIKGGKDETASELG